MIGKVVSHYKILEKLGEGGMGVIYKARDLRLDRTVALKFLPPELTRDPDAKQRFIQEAKAASALQHGNICVVYDIDETSDGQLFISMEYLKGETLKERITARPLTLEEATGIVLQVARGLAKAHEQGIVHRDIKPANIMVTNEGVAKIVDFGLAKLTGQARLTRTGSTLGTAAYMSPEQAGGEDVDHRTDIWSLGVVMFEILTGRLPFRGDHEAALLYAIVHEDAQAISCLRPEVPGSVVSVVSKALQKNCSVRYQTVNELMDDLRSAAGPTSDPSKQEKSIVVLPFDDLSPDHDQEYFSDGLTEEIISDLSNVQALRVISRSSAMTFKGTRKKVPEIAREMNVRYVLEGSVRKAGNSLRITAQLIDGANDAHLWAEKYSGTLDDVFDIQEKVSRSILEALKLRLTLREERVIAEKPIGKGAAYECYLRAKHEIMSFTFDGLDRALRYLHNGLAIIGDNAMLYAGLAYAHAQLANLGFNQEENLREARAYVEKALSLDRESAQGNLVLAILSALEGDTRRALRHLRLSLAREPGEADTAAWLAWTYLLVGKTAPLSALVEKYFRRDPANPNWALIDGMFHFFGGRFDVASERLARAYEVTSDVPMFQFWYALCLAYAGRLDGCTAVLSASAIAPPTEDAWINLCKLLHFTLRRDREGMANLLTKGTSRTFRRDCQNSYHTACFYAYLDERDPALDWLENAVSRGMLNYPMLAEHDPFLKNLRVEERFKRLMERLRKEWEELMEVP